MRASHTGWGPSAIVDEPRPEEPCADLPDLDLGPIAIYATKTSSGELPSAPGSMPDQLSASHVIRVPAYTETGKTFNTRLASCDRAGSHFTPTVGDCVPTKRIDASELRDAKILAITKRHAEIDFIKWTDDDASLALVVPGLKRQGLRSTLHDLTAKKFASLPPAILIRPVAAVELAIDFHAFGKVPRSDEVELLIETYMVLHRRLAPWRAPFVGDRIYRNRGPGSQARHLSSKKPLLEQRADGIWLREYEAPTIWRPFVVSSDLRCYTVYFGDTPTPNWANLGWMPEPRAEVRLYIKVTDQRRPIDQKLWRTRVEINLNGAAMAEVLGVRTVGELRETDMRLLATEFLSLMRTRAMTTKPLNKMRRGPLRALLQERRQSIADRDAYDGTLQGNYSQFQGGAVEFKPVPKLNIHITSPLREFQRSIQRWKTVGI